MLIFLNKKIRNNFIRQTLLKWEEEKECARRYGPDPRRGHILCHNRTGQVAIVLILITAIALIFFIVSFNLGRVSQTKTQVTIAANVAASQMASLVASFGQSLYMGQLGGEAEDCGMSGFFMALVDFVVGTVIGFITGGPAGAIIAAIQGSVNIALQVTYVEQFYANLWANTMSETLSMRDDFIERGISTALQTAVSDNARVPDLYDSDGDRVWGINPNTQAPNDYIGRYGFYYNERLQTLAALDTSAIVRFMAALQDLLYFVDRQPPPDPPPIDTWAFFDDTPLPDACDYVPGPWNDAVPSVCNPCCVPENAMHPFGGAEPVDYRPKCCDTGEDDECGTSSTCLENSPYENINIKNTSYQYVYDPFLESWENNVFRVSFREALGRDDEHRYYHEIPPSFYSNPLNMNGIIQSEDPPMGFLLADASDFRPLPMQRDYRHGSFPFFYKLADWGADLTTATPLNITNHPEHCYWYDSEYETGCRNVPLPSELFNFKLDLTEIPNTLIFNQNDFVDNVDTPKNQTFCSNSADCPPLAPDKVGVSTILAADNACAQDFLKSTYTGGGFWKRGGDQFCSNGDNAQGEPAIEWPYSSWCDKHGTGCVSGGANPHPIQCPCGDPGARDEIYWPDDPLDDIIYKVIPGLVELEKTLGRSDAQVLAQTFAEWYQQVSRWIEPEAGIPDQVCFNCTQRGTLWVLLDVITAMIDHLVSWRDEGHIGANCGEVWCVPPAQVSNNEYGIQECSGVSPEEASTFNTSDTIRGGVADIIGCLNWNISDQGANNTAVGNADKFDHCGDNCTIADCSDLPRSLLPTASYNPAPYNGTNPDGYQPTPARDDEAHIRRFLDCYDQCDAAHCNNTLPTLHTDGTFYTHTTYPGSFNPADECGIDGKLADKPGNAWYDIITENLIDAGPSCDLTDMGDPSTSGWLTNTRQSALEAANQVAKFSTRSAFLVNRLAEANNLINLLGNAQTQLNNFLTCGAEPDTTDDGPACELIKARIALSNQALGLPYQAIYVWQSDPPPNRAEGYWHAVRVDTRLSGKCDEACGPGGYPNSGDPWPRITNGDEDSFWGDIEFRDCFFLDEAQNDGVVKARVTRFDEERDANNLKFPGGLSIWNFKSNHPSREAKFGSIASDIIAANCTDFMVDGPNPVPADRDIYKGAFILNEETFDNQECWRAMNEHLSRGITSETCAQYYFHEGNNAGFGFRFVPCDPF